MDEQHIRNLIEACRPGSQDVQLPEMQELAEQLDQSPQLRQVYQRVQRQDATLSDAFSDVPVPEGLADRLLASLAEQTPTATADAGRPAQDCPPVAVAARRGGLWKGVAAAGGVAVTVAALLLALLWVDPEPSGPASGEELAGQVLQWWDQALEQQEQWRQDLESAPGGRYPVDPAIRAAARSWQPIDCPYDPAAVMYDMTPPGKQRVVLFVIRTRPQFTVSTVPLSPLPSTGGYSLGAWQHGELLYVLMVEGERQRLQQFIQPPVLGQRPPPRGTTVSVCGGPEWLGKICLTATL